MRAFEDHAAGERKNDGMLRSAEDQAEQKQKEEVGIDYLPSSINAIVHALSQITPGRSVVIVIHPTFTHNFRHTTSEEFDRETEARLLKLGVLGYFNHIPVIENPNLDSAHGWELV